MNDKKYFLTPNEFSVISAGFGLSMVYGLKQIDGRLDSKEICMALHNMYINNLIENPDSKQFITDANITEIMRRVKKSHFFVRIESMLGNSECTFCLYPGSPCVVLEENKANANKIILYMEEFESVCEMLATETAGKTMTIDCMSTSNGRVISDEVVSDQADKNDRVTMITKQYKSIMPAEVQ